MIDSDTADLCYAHLYFSYSQDEEGEEDNEEVASPTTKTTPAEDVHSPSNGEFAETAGMQVMFFLVGFRVQPIIQLLIIIDYVVYACISSFKWS